MNINQRKQLVIISCILIYVYLSVAYHLVLGSDFGDFIIPSLWAVLAFIFSYKIWKKYKSRFASIVVFLSALIAIPAVVFICLMLFLAIALSGI